MKKIKQERGRLGQKQQLLPCSNETDLLRDASQYRLLGRSQETSVFCCCDCCQLGREGKKTRPVAKTCLKYESMAQIIPARNYVLSLLSSKIF